MAERNIPVHPQVNTSPEFKGIKTALLGLLSIVAK